MFVLSLLPRNALALASGPLVASEQLPEIEECSPASGLTMAA
jgi:hypothetical protein